MTVKKWYDKYINYFFCVLGGEGEEDNAAAKQIKTKTQN